MKKLLNQYLYHDGLVVKSGHALKNNLFEDDIKRR
jgi:hypothetical protein